MDNLPIYASLIDLEINGEKVDVVQELTKPTKERVLIQPTDHISIAGAVMMDGFHDATSKNKYVSKNNHVRTRFDFEHALVGIYTVSEVLEPPKEIAEHMATIGGNNTPVSISDVYYLQKGDIVETVLKETILKNKL